MQKIPKYGHGNVLWMGKCLRISIYKRQKFEKIYPAKVGWHQSLKLDLAILGGSTFCTFLNFFKFLPFINADPEAFSHP